MSWMTVKVSNLFWSFFAFFIWSDLLVKDKCELARSGLRNWANKWKPNCQEDHWILSCKISLHSLQEPQFQSLPQNGSKSENKSYQREHISKPCISFKLMYFLLLFVFKEFIEGISRTILCTIVRNKSITASKIPAKTKGFSLKTLSCRITPSKMSLLAVAKVSK